MEEIGKETFHALDEEQHNELSEILLNTQEQCQMMAQLIENQIKKKDEQIDRLHGELEYYKNDQAGQLVEAAMKEIIALRQGMLKKTASPKWDSLDAGQLRREFIYQIEDLTDLLERQGIDAWESAPGEPFDAARHKAVSLEAAPSPQLDKCVARSVSAGYRKGKKILLPEKVVVWKQQ